MTVAASFGVYSSYRHLASNPDVQVSKGVRGADLKEFGTDTQAYHEARLERGRSWVRSAHGSDFVLAATANTPWTKEGREASN